MYWYFLLNALDNTYNEYDEMAYHLMISCTLHVLVWKSFLIVTMNSSLNVSDDFKTKKQLPVCIHMNILICNSEGELEYP